MTKERLDYLINICKHRQGSETQHYQRVAEFLGVSPVTLRRWLNGERPVPRYVEVIMTILHFWPEVTAEAVDKVVRALDEGSKT
jgi:transcriptional regulator with XRE-family HTH domain